MNDGVREGERLAGGIRLKDYTMNRTLTKRLIFGIFAFEAVLPGVMLITTQEPRTYSWSMYSQSLATYRYVGDTHGGRTVDLDPAEVGSPSWNAPRYGPQTLRLLCERHPELGSITRYVDGKVERSEQC